MGTDDQSLTAGYVSAIVCKLLAMIYLNISLSIFSETGFVVSKAGTKLTEQRRTIPPAFPAGALGYKGMPAQVCAVLASTQGSLHARLTF